MKGFRLVIFVLLYTIPISTYSQSLSKEELADYTSRAKRMIQIFLDNLPYIADSKNPMKSRQEGVNVTLKIFSAKAYIQEQNKFSGRKTTWKPSDYFNTILKRSESAPILIDFKIIDDLAPEKMIAKKNADGSISYYGKMVFRQYYCKLKEDNRYKEPTKRDPDINCTYSDTTDKQVNFELTVRENITGKYWVTLINSIEVLRVF